MNTQRLGKFCQPGFPAKEKHTNPLKINLIIKHLIHLSHHKIDEKATRDSEKCRRNRHERINYENPCSEVGQILRSYLVVLAFCLVSDNLCQNDKCHKLEILLISDCSIGGER